MLKATKNLLNEESARFNLGCRKIKGSVGLKI